MAINRHEHFESHMDIASPETTGDAEKIETFSEDAYDDLFDKRLAYLDALECKTPSKAYTIPDVKNNKVYSDHEHKHNATVSNTTSAHLSSLLQHRNHEYDLDVGPQDTSISESEGRNKSLCTDDPKNEIISIKGSFDSLPDNRQESIYNSFEDAPTEIKRMVNLLSNKLSVEKTVGDDDSHYDLLDKKIRMEENLDDSEYAEVFSHEYGHFVDNQLGDVSETTEFRKAIVKDLERFDRGTEVGIEKFNEMMDDLMNSDAAFDMAVSDNMSAYFQNDPEIMKRYTSEGIAYYGHDNDYWATFGTREAEIYANSFSMSAQNNEASCEFMKKYFPYTWEQFKLSLQGGRK